MYSLHISSKTRKFYTDGGPGIDLPTMTMLVASTKTFDLFLGMYWAYRSENMKSKNGRRKPFITAGFPLWSFAFLMLCLAPEEMGEGATALYFGELLLLPPPPLAAAAGDRALLLLPATGPCCCC